MKKQILFFVVLTVLPVVYPVTAAPNDALGSTEKADRQFLQNLEQADAAKAERAPNVPAPAEDSRPATTGPGKSGGNPTTAQSTTVLKGPRTIVLADDYDQATQPDEVAAYETIPEERPSTVSRVIIVRPARSVHTERHHSIHHSLHRFFSRLLNFDD